MDFLGSSAGKESASNSEALVGKIDWRRDSYPLQYSGLKNSMGCLVHGVAKNWT